MKEYRVIPVTIILVILISGTLGFAVSNPEVFAATAKVTVCHKPGTPAEQTIEVPEAAVPGHIGHGDFVGSCEAPPPPTPEADNFIVCVCGSGDDFGFCDPTSCDLARDFCADVCGVDGLSEFFCSPPPNFCPAP